MPNDCEILGRMNRKCLKSKPSITNDKDKIKYMTTEPVIDKYPIEYTPKYIAEQILDRTFCTT